MLKVLLLQPCAEMSLVQGYNPGLSECLGIGYIAAYLKERGIDVDILDANAEIIDEMEIINRIRDKNYQVIGIPMIASQLEEIVIKLIIFLSTNLIPKPYFVIGGSYATLAHLELLKQFPVINYVIRGEGEKTFYQLLLALEEGECYPASIFGLSYRDAEGNIYVNPDRLLIDNLDSLPKPIRYNAERIAKAGRSIYIFSSRGCYGRCSFCGVKTFCRLGEQEACEASVTK